ncbi:50S ribosomal protein L35 [bacterium]|jgi:large subunit ribosomal protein L35|nr:50S ribosomal protein L35 [bacterium]
MPKVKSKKSAVKRFKKTATGKILYARANAGHLMRKKNSGKRRKLRRSDTLVSKEQRKISKML